MPATIESQPGTVIKRTRRVQVHFTGTQSHWKILPGPLVLMFDSHSAGDTVAELNWWQGFAGGTARGFTAPMLLNGKPVGLNVLWAEFTYANGKQALIGAVLNSSLEQCPGRVHGDIRVSVDGAEVLNFTGATALDSCGMHFHSGTVQPLVRWDVLRWMIARAADVADPPENYFRPPACPDVPSGMEWQQPWSEADRSQDPRYHGSSSNPNVILDIGTTPVPRWYDRQTHRPGDYRKATVSDFFSIWWAIQQAKMSGMATPEVATLEARWAEATIWWTAAQVGAPSPAVPGKWVDGRPLHWQLRSGELVTQGKKYNLSDLDRALPRAAEWHEGRPLLRQPSSRFTEHLNRETLTLAEANASRYAGQYIGPNGADPEHWATAQLFAIATLTGNPFAIMELHQLGQEALDYDSKTYQHSDRTWGNLVKDGLLHPWLFFRDTRYLEKARWALAWLETHKVDWTPYKCYLSRGYVNVPPKGSGNFQGGFALGQHSTIIVACVEWSRSDPDPAWRARWIGMAKYGIECVDVPGVYDPSRGGFIDTVPMNGPQPLTDASDTRTVSERVEANTKYPDRSMINWQGWIIPAYAMYAAEVDDQERLGRAGGWTVILAGKSVSRTPVLSKFSDGAWNMLYPLIAIYGRPTFLAAPGAPEEPKEGETVSDGAVTTWGVTEDESEAMQWT